MSKKKIALIINIIIILLELLGLGITLFQQHHIAVEYYTNDSNIVALISSILFVVFYKRDLALVKDIRFIATSCLAVTFLVVLFILSPMYDFNYKLLMFTDSFLIFHTLCPILSILSYVVFEDRSSKNYLCLLFTIIYSIVLITLNLIDVVKGPYPFLMVKNQSIIMSLVWAILIIGGSYIIGFLLNFINKKIKGANL